LKIFDRKISKSARLASLVVMVLLICSNSQIAVAENFIPTGITTQLDVAQMGMGGMTVVIPGNTHAVFYNPALLAGEDFDVDFIPLMLGLDNDALEVIDFIDEHQYEFENFDSLNLAEKNEFMLASQKFDNKWVSAIYSPYFGVNLTGLGFGFYSVHHADIKVDQGVFFPAVGLRGYEDNVIGFGFGKKLNLFEGDYNAGLTVRITERKTFKPERVSAEDVDRLTEVFATAWEEFESFETGISVDFGLIREIQNDNNPDQTIRLGLAIHDLFSELDGYVKPDVKLAVLINDALPMMINNMQLGFELNDLFNREGVGLFQKINLGGELPLLYNILKLRGGFHQGYPTIGLGLKLLIFRGDYAYFSRELGTRAGQNAETTHRLQFSISF